MTNNYEIVFFDGELSCGAFIHDGMVLVPVDYTMYQLVSAIKESGYISFKLPTMRKLVRI